MSMMRCHRHDENWDSDFLECCPRCEALSIEVERADETFVAYFVTDPSEIAVGDTEDAAIENLLMRS